MHFQSIGYLVSDRPHAHELRKSLKLAVVGGARAYLSRLSRGRLSRSSEENRRKYDGLAGAYHTASATEIPKLRVFRGQLALVPGRDIRRDWVAKLADKVRVHGEPSAILEVGSGDGNNFPLLHEQFPNAKLTGIDISPKRVEFAQKHPPYQNINATFQVASATELPFPDNSFDAVYSMYCLEHLPREYPQAIREMVRVARRCVVLIEPVPEHRGAAQRIYARASDFLRGLPDFLEREHLEVDSVELLDSATVPLNMGSLITIKPAPSNGKTS
jgi:SAM-dependent methyltransferase